MHDRLASRVAVELRKMAHLFETYADLLTRVNEREPDPVELAALSQVIQSFYGGVESIFESVAKLIDQEPPGGPDWHHALLDQMGRPGARRGPVITRGVQAELAEYLGFRHVGRHSYVSQLEWSKLRELVRPLPGVRSRFRCETEGFLDRLRSPESDTP